MNYTNTAAHVFKMSEQTNRTVFSIISEVMADYPKEEIDKMAAVMTDGEITVITLKFADAAYAYNQQSETARKDKDYERQAMLVDSCIEMNRRAALWSMAVGGK